MKHKILILKEKKPRDNAIHNDTTVESPLFVWDQLIFVDFLDTPYPRVFVPSKFNKVISYLAL